MPMIKCWLITNMKWVFVLNRLGASLSCRDLDLVWPQGDCRSGGLYISALYTPIYYRPDDPIIKGTTQPTATAGSRGPMSHRADHCWDNYVAHYAPLHVVFVNYAPDPIPTRVMINGRADMVSVTWDRQAKATYVNMPVLMLFLFRLFMKEVQHCISFPALNPLGVIVTY